MATCGDLGVYPQIMISSEVSATPELDEFLFSDSDKRAEFTFGSKAEKPLPGKEHARLQRRLLILLTQFLESKAAGEAFPEWHHRFGSSADIRIYVPDIAVVLGETENSRYASRASDIMIEILSPQQNLLEFLNKVEFYLANGAKRVWVVDPETKSIQAYSRDQAPQSYKPDQIFRDNLLAGLEIPLADLFAGLA